MTSLQPPSLPIPLHLPEFDDDDAFDAKDDSPTAPYVFSPDAIREEMARNMPTSAESWGESETTASTGRFFLDHNPSVSTLDIESHEPELQETPPHSPLVPASTESSLSSNFSQISLSDGSHEELPTLDESASSDVPPPNGNHNGSYRNGFGEVSESPAEPTRTPSPPPLPSPLPQQRKRSLTKSTPLPPAPLSAPIEDTSRSSSDISRPSPPHSAAAAASSTVPSQSLPTLSSAPESSQTSTYLTEKTFAHRAHRSVGPSAFEKVRSKTRPTFLPPKPREEDEKHMADWQQMMKHSRLAAEKRRKALQERRMKREKAIEDTQHIWEKEILPDWRVVHRNATLRKLWWKGIPTKLRAPLWEKAVGNELALSKDHYRACLSRAKRALTSGVFPKTTLDLMEQDMETTLPALHIFHKETGPLYADLKDMLCAWVVSRSDEGLGYTLGAAKIAAMLLINMPPQQAFIVMRNLLERHCLRSFFGGERVKDDVEAYYRIFDTMLADGMPKIYFNFKQHQISPSAYLPDWVIPLFLDHLPFESCARIWDVLFLEGDSFLYRAALGILAVLEPRLFFPDRKELLELLRGENQAAIEVAKREGRPLNGGKYEIYGVDEETLWDRIESMDDWWKDSTWTRLIQRELPDI